MMSLNVYTYTIIKIGPVICTPEFFLGYPLIKYAWLNDRLR